MENEFENEHFGREMENLALLRHDSNLTLGNPADSNRALIHIRLESGVSNRCSYGRGGRCTEPGVILRQNAKFCKKCGAQAKQTAQ